MQYGDFDDHYAARLYSEHDTAQMTIRLTRMKMASDASTLQSKSANCASYCTQSEYGNLGLEWSAYPERSGESKS